MIEALLLDIGDVITAAPWKVLDAVECRTGRALLGRGALDPERDILWQAYLAGELSYMGYWSRYAIANGYTDWRALFRDCSEEMGIEGFAHPDAASFINDVRGAGFRLGVLTNDGVGIGGRDFLASVPALAGMDAFVNAREHGGGKPAPEAYHFAASELGVATNKVLFLDDMPICVDGARAVGMTALLVDPVDRNASFMAARRLLGLGGGNSVALICDMGEALRAKDIDRIASLTDPDIVIRWNGRRVAVGHDDLRKFYGSLFSERPDDWTWQLHPLTVTDDAISLQRQSTHRDFDSRHHRCSASEHWTLRRNRLIELLVYEHCEIE
jgi:FMN phosphatase YigB (HAD superfamily)/ketosteroid isomerase-like protein